MEKVITDIQGSKGQRIGWLDTVRGMAMIMVVYSHISFCNPRIMEFFSPVFLSVFFFVSGYLTKDGLKFGKFIEQRTRTLYIPFLFWGLLLLCKRHLLSFKSDILPWGADLKAFFLQDGSDNFIWFIPALYVFSIIFYCLERVSKTNLQLILLLSLFAIANWVYLYILDGSALPYHLEEVGFACLLMGLGKLYHRNEASLNRYFKSLYFIIALITYIAACLIFPKMNFNGSRYMLDWAITVFAGLYLMVYISKWGVLQCKPLLYIGANTLICFILHGQVYAVIEQLLKSRLGAAITDSQLLSTSVGILETCVVMAVLIIPIWLINRYLPYTVGKGYKLWKVN